MEDILEAGCKRILTSGQKLTAPDGVELIQQLVVASAGRIIIMPGSGVRKENIAALAIGTGAVEFHSSLRSYSKSNMRFIHPTFANEAGEYDQVAIQSAEVRELYNALEKLK